MSDGFAIVGDCPACGMLAFLVVSGPSRARLTLSRVAPQLDAINVRTVSRGEALAMDYCQCRPDIADELAIRCPWCFAERGKVCRSYRRTGDGMVDDGARVWSHPSRVRQWQSGEVP